MFDAGLGTTESSSSPQRSIAFTILPSTAFFAGISLPNSSSFNGMARFTFPALPQEIQDMVYRKYYQHTEVVIPDYAMTLDDTDPILHTKNLPNIAIEHVCHRTLRDARAIREQVFTRILKIEPCSRKTVLQVLNNRRYSWALQRLQSITFASITAIGQHPVWDDILQNLPELRRIRLEADVLRQSPVPTQTLANLIESDPSHYDLAIINGNIEAFNLSGLYTVMEKRFGQDYEIVVKENSSCLPVFGEPSTYVAPTVSCLRSHIDVYSLTSLLLRLYTKSRESAQ